MEENNNQPDLEKQPPKEMVAPPRAGDASGAEGQMAVEEKESIEVGQHSTATDHPDKEAMSQRILNGEEQSKWFAFALLMVALIALIIARYSNTPAVTKANKSARPPLEQKQEISTPRITEATPRIEAICISGGSPTSALIGGEIVREGDTIKGFRILTIDSNTVQLEKDGRIIKGVLSPPRKPMQPTVSQD